MARVPGTTKKKQCLCVGFDARPTLLIVKLLQFHTNYRPAYFGTWRLANPTIKPRRPFVRDIDLDYEYDSDDDWSEDAEILDAESISGTDEDENEELSEMADEDDIDSNVNLLCWLIIFRIGLFPMDTFQMTRDWANETPQIRRELSRWMMPWHYDRKGRNT
jgi:hypothetical protein